MPAAVASVSTIAGWAMMRKSRRSISANCGRSTARSASGRSAASTW